MEGASQSVLAPFFQVLILVLKVCGDFGHFWESTKGSGLYCVGGLTNSAGQQLGKRFLMCGTGNYCVS